MRMLFFLQSLGVGGPERQIFLLADSLKRRGHLVSVAALHTRDEGWKWFTRSGSVQVRVFFLGTPGGVLSAGSQFARCVLKLRYLLNREGIQVVYSTGGPISNFIAWLATRGMPDTKLIWNVLALGFRTSLAARNWKMALLSPLCKWVSASVPLMISCSQAVYADREAKGYRCQKHVVIYCAIDVSQFRPDPEARARIRHEWAVTENQKLIGLVGRLVPVKGHPIFLKAASSLAHEREDARFVCVGDGSEPYRSQLQRLSQELGLTGRLIWAGATEDMPAVYNALDILCCSSYSEGLNLAIGEAMACGVPCVVTDAGGSVEVVADMGIVVPAGDPRMLSEGLRTALLELHEVKPHLLRERIVRHFSAETMIEATERILTEAWSGGDSS